MRYLIFGDVHGNLPALEKLLKKEEGNFDQLISHGDVVNYGPWSNECVELLNDIPNTIRLKGNHEDAFLSGNYPGSNEVVKAFFEHCYRKFKKTNFIAEYQQMYDIKKFRVQHTISNEYIFPDTDISKMNIKRNYVIGHSHYQFDRIFENNRLINTGSIGQNRKFINLAEYIIVDEEKDILILKNFIYDVSLVINEMIAENFPKICIDYYKTKPQL
ncbi:metallophosphoesterase family protein [Salinimicrobium oceani]|uniref:Metallophosphoesterase n=1 Tax=Salinimicrobium oceani TaxID=2722702 RepID=A0ABX1D265_9FLAO|nr:metallophosphoesterase [Salinimicrobium oceani]NJW53417.1 metallophosphoesterase [Salinimicrobium oceani]